MCIETHLQSGIYFTKGTRTNDLKRVRDNSRWEIKCTRDVEKAILTINQSHKDVDDTIFLLYWGKAEDNDLRGIYVLEGKDDYFTPPVVGRNDRKLKIEHEHKLIPLFLKA